MLTFQMTGKHSLSLGIDDIVSVSPVHSDKLFIENGNSIVILNLHENKSKVIDKVGRTFVLEAENDFILFTLNEKDEIQVL